MKEVQSNISKPFGAYFFIMCSASIVYTVISVVTMSHNYRTINAYEHDEELRTILLETICNIIFKTFTDVQVIVYFILNGSISFFYMHILLQIARLVRYGFVEGVTVPDSNITLYILYLLSNVMRIIISIMWSNSAKSHFYERWSTVSNHTVSSKYTYFTVYYMLEGCALLIINRFIFHGLLWIYTYKYTSRSDMLNTMWSGATSSICWYFLWAEKRHSQRKWFMYMFYSINILRFVVTYIASGERRYTLNTYYRGATVSERLLRIVERAKGKGFGPMRNRFLNVLDNLEYFIIDILYNVYFVWYCVLLYMSRGERRPVMGKARYSIEQLSVGSTEEAA
ncbi:uncharacterized protein NEMAJ01_2308 [Nematocida major]|uniref:uncharacterized protein n=1 Tax=Nematocida major TaxID=1912982 RepID=UPI0020077F98|nr:uncharacterized protein NEMAJ01_2308 [Nematocida major]KAH9387412.1 hypothetical protein NEMAJ01_2308 [Nematocida major]